MPPPDADNFGICPVELDLDTVNETLRDASAAEVVRWALGQGRRAIATTSMGRNAAVMLHLVSQVDANLPTIWVDTGYNSSATYRFAEKLMNELDLKVDVYTPEMTSARRNVLMKGIPDVGEPLHEEFTRQVKLEPFGRAIREAQPEVWITGLRREQTEHRKNMDIVTRSKDGYLKVAPILDWTEADMNQYLEDNNLPNEADYFDPTKGQEGRECGLHTTF